MLWSDFWQSIKYSFKFDLKILSLISHCVPLNKKKFELPLNVLLFWNGHRLSISLKYLSSLCPIVQMSICSSLFPPSLSQSWAASETMMWFFSSHWHSNHPSLLLTIESGFSKWCVKLIGCKHSWIWRTTSLRITLSLASCLSIKLRKPWQARRSYAGTHDLVLCSWTATGSGIGAQAQRTEFQMQLVSATQLHV